MEPHPYGWFSLLPPFLAVGLAIVTKRAVVSLLAAILCGAVITAGGDPLVTIHDFFEVHLWPTLISESKLRLFSFTLLMGAMVGVIIRSGGMQGLIELISPLAKSRRSGQFTTWLLGLVIFFDDYCNTLLLGNTLRAVADRLRISREKLAYLVDSTAAPVAGLAILSTWVAVEVDTIGEGLLGIPKGNTLDAFDLFLETIPYRFYMIMTLLFVLLVAVTGRDFGGMLAAERRTLHQRRDGSDDAAGDDSQVDEKKSHWINAVLPIAVTLGFVVVLLYNTGVAAADVDSSGAQPSLRRILGSADSSLALQYGALAGLAVASVLAMWQKLLTSSEVSGAIFYGVKIVFPAILILWTASALSRMTGDKSVDGQPSHTAYEYKSHRLYTGEFLVRVLQEPGSAEDGSQPQTHIAAGMLPTVVFLVAAVLSFSTGTSYGTMAILMPMVISLAYSMLSGDGQALSSRDPILLASIGSVLAGAVFGDHCSPISDTTILSSQSCACNHISHVLTQMPYALTVGGVTILCGTLPIGWGVSLWILLPLQLAALVGLLYLFGRNPESTPAPEGSTP